MENEISLGQTLIEMGIKNGWWIEDGKIYWVEGYNGLKPTEEEVKEKREQLIKEEQYKKDRLLAYPSLSEQLDNLYHDIKNSGAIDKEGRFFKAIEKVKTDNPKPNKE